jgi:hypothetical protein
MSATATQRTTKVPPSPPSSPRMRLAPTRAGQAVLDGGWWPRSWDPVAELPGLILALAERYGRIRHVMINNGAWDSRFRKLAVGTATVRMGWFVSLDAALLIAITDRGDQIDLLIVPPQTAEAAALGAMARAADPANLMRAPAMLAARVPATGNDTDLATVWENEGGHTEPELVG